MAIFSSDLPSLDPEVSPQDPDLLDEMDPLEDPLRSPVRSTGAKYRNGDRVLTLLLAENGFH